MIGFYGFRGAGKTLTCVSHIYELFKDNPDLVVITNTPLYFPLHKRMQTPLKQIFWDDISQLENFFAFAMLHEDLMLKHEFLVLIDEANLVLPSRLFAKLPEFMLSFMAQSRKFNIEIYFTTQNPLRVDKILRELTESWVHCKRYLPSFLPQWFLVNTEQELSVEGKSIESHRSKILFRPSRFYGFYDTYFKVAMPEDIIPQQHNNSGRFFDFLEAYIGLTRIDEKDMNSKKFKNLLENLDDYVNKLKGDRLMSEREEEGERGLMPPLPRLMA